jgi:predicted methyltransferase
MAPFGGFGEDRLRFPAELEASKTATKPRCASRSVDGFAPQRRRRAPLIGLIERRSLAMRILTAVSVVLLCSLAPVTLAVTPREALDRPGRLPDDVERDARSRPRLILELLDLEAGDRVADIFGGAGYYSELMATIVGASGVVLLHNNAAYAEYAEKGLKRRFEGRDAGSIRLHQREADDLDLGEGQLDAVILVMSYHDLYHVSEGWPAIDSRHFLGQLLRALKPGGRLLIIDHHAKPGSGKSAAQDLHRIDIEFARSDITANGFELVTESDALRNPADDYGKMVFDPSVHGRTDRFVLLFRRPP